MRLVIISLDLLIALPILTTCFALLFTNIIGSQSYVLALSRTENRTLNLFVTSQQIANRIDSNQSNLSAASKIAAELSAKNGVASLITRQNSTVQCGNFLAVCRFVTISGSSHLLVVYYGSTN